MSARVCANTRARACVCVCVCARLLKSSILRSVGDDFREIERSLREIQCFQNAGARAIVDDRAGLWIARGPLFACPPPPILRRGFCFRDVSEEIPDE